MPAAVTCTGPTPVSASACLPPVAAPDARLLVLGSLPGARSLAEARYYAHPRNQFWRLMGAVLDAPLDALPYADRLATVRAHGLALWDTVATAHRRGSLDAAIRDAAPNDLPALLARLPLMRAVACNGALATRLARAALAGIDLPVVPLPSSSPALTWTFERKLDLWLPLRDWL